jgi:hypothetical protein
MAKLKVKGTIIEQATGTTYTAIAQVVSFGVNGIETETYDSRTLDGTVGVEYDPTGYTEGGSVTFDLLYDPALAGHQAITDLATAGHLTTNGLPNDQGWKIKFANTSSTELTFVSAGIGVDITGDASDGLRSSITLKCDGCPVLPS